MALTREDLQQLVHLLRPLSTRIVNLAGRATIQLVDDTGAIQRVQLGGIVGAPYDDAEHFQPWGISAVPLTGASCLVVFPNGDRGHPLVFAAADPNRPSGGEPGQFAIYNHTGATVILTKDGDIKVRAAPGRQVLIDDGSGSPEPVVKRSEFLAHGHPIIASGATSPCAGPVTGAAPAGSSSTFPGTAALQSK